MILARDVNEGLIDLLPNVERFARRLVDPEEAVELLLDPDRSGSVFVSEQVILL